ncbi:MAG: hypothetical protein V3U71_08575 [Cocleimonas sp.]
MEISISEEINNYLYLFNLDTKSDCDPTKIYVGDKQWCELMNSGLIKYGENIRCEVFNLLVYKVDSVDHLHIA